MKIIRFAAVLACLTAAACKPDAATPAEPVESTPAPSMNADLLRAIPAQAAVGQPLAFEPVDGHHFETKAPQRCGEADATDVTGAKLWCQFDAPGVHRVALNVCDNAKTYCKPVRFEVTTAAQ